MAQQDVIYPAEPLLIVDRQYRKNKSQNATFSVQSTKCDVTISVYRRQSSSFNQKFETKVSTNPGALKCSKQGRKFEFVNATQESKTLCTKKRPATKRKVEHGRFEVIAAKVNPSPADSILNAAYVLQRSSPLRLGSVVPNSSTTFYAYAGAHVKSNAKDLLEYCKSLKRCHIALLTQYKIR